MYRDGIWRRSGRRHYSMARRPGRSVLRVLLLGLCLLAGLGAVRADVLVPLQAELSVYPDGRWRLHLRGDLTRLLLGADARASAAGRAEARRLRALSDTALRDELRAHPERLARRLALRLDGRRVPLTVRSAAWQGTGGAGEIELGGALAEGVRHIDFGYARSVGRVVFRYRRYDPHRAAWSDWQWLDRRTAHPARAGQTAPPLAQVVGDYLWLGFTHILPKGLDHILFIIGLFLLSPRWRSLLGQVSVFTLAHTGTLALTASGLLRVSPALVEPLIALSIAWVGVENLLRRDLQATRLAVVFAFGLLHGMGFAGVLTELGLPAGRFVAALLSFNAGVELGQVAVLLLCLLVVGWPLRGRPARWRMVAQPASLGIAALGLVWAVQRVPWL